MDSYGKMQRYSKEISVLDTVYHTKQDVKEFREGIVVRGNAHSTHRLHITTTGVQ